MANCKVLTKLAVKGLMASSLSKLSRFNGVSSANARAATLSHETEINCGPRDTVVVQVTVYSGRPNDSRTSGQTLRHEFTITSDSAAVRRLRIHWYHKWTNASARSISRYMAPCWCPKFGHLWRYRSENRRRPARDQAEPPRKAPAEKSVTVHTYINTNKKQ